MLEVKKIYKVSENIILRGINKKFWALDSKNGAQYRLNELSFDILSNLDGKNTLECIIEAQYNKYQVNKELLINDVIGFIHKSLEKGIIIEVDQLC